MSLGVFLVIGVATFVLGIVRINKAIYLPFVRKQGFSIKTAEQLEKERLDKLRAQDTDNDTLNDYDELYVFRTSPFLEDSDSDGVNDGQEVAQESDPNCPKGKVCRQVRVSSTGGTASGEQIPTSGSTAPTGTPPPTEQEAQAEAYVLGVVEEYFGPLDALTPEKIVAGLDSMSAPKLREFLGKLGIPAQALERADDATLRKLVKETLDELVAQWQASGQASGATNSATTP